MRLQLSQIFLGGYLCTSSHREFGRDGVVGIVTGYELDGPEFEPHCSKIVSHLRIQLDRTLGPTHVRHGGIWCSFPEGGGGGVKAVGASRRTPTAICTEVKNN